MATSADSTSVKTQTFHHLLDENSCKKFWKPQYRSGTFSFLWAFSAASRSLFTLLRCKSKTSTLWDQHKIHLYRHSVFPHDVVSGDPFSFNTTRGLTFLFFKESSLYYLIWYWLTVPDFMVHFIITLQWWWNIPPTNNQAFFTRKDVCYLLSTVLIYCSCRLPFKSKLPKCELTFTMK